VLKNQKGRPSRGRNELRTFRHPILSASITARAGQPEAERIYELRFEARLRRTVVDSLDLFSTDGSVGGAPSQGKDISGKEKSFL
jgi:hypothetical protein